MPPPRKTFIPGGKMTVRTNPQTQQVAEALWPRGLTEFSSDTPNRRRPPPPSRLISSLIEVRAKQEEHERREMERMLKEAQSFATSRPTSAGSIRTGSTGSTPGPAATPPTQVETSTPDANFYDDAANDDIFVPRIDVPVWGVTLYKSNASRQRRIEKMSAPIGFRARLPQIDVLNPRLEKWMNDPDKNLRKHGRSLQWW